LQRWGLADLVAFLLDGGGPLTLITAQLFYVGQPIFGHSTVASSMPEGHIQAIANMMENHEEAQAFAAFLREEKQQ
jgi:hypothetical protein